MRVIKPYLALSALAIFWALLIFRAKFPRIQSEHESGGDRGHFRELFAYPHFLMAVLAQFMYVGAQVGTWSYFIQYVQEFTHQPEKVAGYFLTGTLAAFGIGRFISAWLMRFVAPTKLLGSYAMVNVALVGFAMLRPSWAGLWALFATSFFMSLMFPTIFALGLKGLGPNTKIGRIVDRDGHRRRGNSHSAHGTDRRGSSHHRSGLHCPACGICRHRRVRIPWGTGTRCGRHSRPSIS